MRDKNLNFIQFTAAVENFIGSKTKISKDRRTSVVDSPTLLEDFYLVLPLRFTDFRNLCISVHFEESEVVRFRLLLDLEERVHKFDLRKQLELKILLSSKKNMLLYLFLTQQFTSHEIFGNLLSGGIKALVNLQIKRKNTKVVKAQRKRGYNDHGSLRPREKWLETYDFSFTVAQNEKEKKLYLHQKSITKILKFFKELKVE